MKAVRSRHATPRGRRSARNGARRPLAVLAALVLGAGSLLVPLPGHGAAQAAPAVEEPSGKPAEKPAEQSDRPAPPSREKLVLDHGHIDAFTPVLGEGDSLELMIKEDVTALNELRVPETVVLQVKPSALTEIPSGFVPGLSGEVYHLPLIQDPELIWPGWETQLITSKYPDADTEIVVSEIDGPGQVFLWSQNAFGGVKSLLLDGGYELPATISQPYPAHTHAAWAFTEAGSYTFTVRADVTAGDGRSASTQTARYTFVIGELEEHTSGSSTGLAADTEQSDPGQAVTFTAQVRLEREDERSEGDGRRPEGAVQFRDLSNDTILGHTPLDEHGGATFLTAALQPGEHRIVAEFVPTWSIDSKPSASTPVTLLVTGEQAVKPDFDDTEPASDEELAGVDERAGLRVTNPDRAVPVGGTVTVQLDEGSSWGEWVSLWLHGEQARWLGWVQSDLEGRLTVTLDEEVVAGAYRLSAKDREGVLIGWDVLLVESEKAPPPPAPSPKPAPPAPTPAAPAECQPPVTLDHGHIDAFTVSAGGGLAVLQILEDVTGHRVLREAETVLLRVKESAYSSIPGLPGGPAGYVLPLAQHPNLIWPGWDTNRTTASGYTDVSINVTAVDGPGRVYLYTSQGAFGGWRPILTHGGYAFPGTIHEPGPAHTHAQWVFSQKGVYVLTAHAVATNPNTGASLTTASHSYVFQVGDAPLGDVFCGLSAHGADDAAFVHEAVLQAAEQAVAAEQATAEKAEKKVKRSVGRRAASAEAESGLLASELPIGVLVGVVSGGALLLGGIAGGTAVLLRRMREGLPRD